MRRNNPGTDVMLSPLARKLLEDEIAVTRDDARYHRELSEGLDAKADILANGLMDETRQALRLDDDGGAVQRD